MGAAQSFGFLDARQDLSRCAAACPNEAGADERPAEVENVATPPCMNNGGLALLHRTIWIAQHPAAKGEPRAHFGFRIAVEEVSDGAVPLLVIQRQRPLTVLPGPDEISPPKIGVAGHSVGDDQKLLVATRFRRRQHVVDLVQRLGDTPLGHYVVPEPIVDGQQGGAMAQGFRQPQRRVQAGPHLRCRPALKRHPGYS